MPDTNWGEVADERINNNIDFSKISTKEDYHDAVKNYLENVHSPSDKSGFFRGQNIVDNRVIPFSNIVDEMWNAESTQKKMRLVETDELNAFKKAQRLERRRPKRSRLIDERTTAKDNRIASKRSVKYWSRRMGRLDIRGVDTRIARKLSPRNMITKMDLRLKKYKVEIDSRGIKHYRGSNGRWVANPYKRN